MAVDPLASVASKASILPGNALGSTTIPSFPDVTKSETIGSQPVSWSSWISYVGGMAYKALNPITSIMPVAGQIVEGASREANYLIDKAEGGVTAASTGIGTFLQGLKDSIKYLAWALMAVAVIYVLATFVAPLVGLVKRK